MSKYDLLFDHFYRNYPIYGLGLRLLSNIICYAINNAENSEQTKELLNQLLLGIGLKEGELDELERVLEKETLNFECN